MHTGKGFLLLRDGRRLALNFQFGTDFDEMRTGYLHLDTSGIDPACYSERLSMVCEDGTNIQLEVVHFSDRHLAVTGHTVSLAA